MGQHQEGTPVGGDGSDGRGGGGDIEGEESTQPDDPEPARIASRLAAQPLFGQPRDPMTCQPSGRASERASCRSDR